MASERIVVELIRELIQLHCDRVLLYHQALPAVLRPDRMDLKPIFGEIMRESLECQQELQDNIARLDGRTNGHEKQHKGDIYWIWEHARGPIRGDNSKSILATCEQEGEAVQQAYRAVLSSDVCMDDILQLRLSMQLINLRNIQEQIREYHDAL